MASAPAAAPRWTTWRLSGARCSRWMPKFASSGDALIGGGRDRTTSGRNERRQRSDRFLMSKRGWILFLALGVIWGMPYLLIRIAVESIDPLVVAFGRTLIGALLLLPVALYRNALAPAFRRWRWLLAFTLIEISGPWLLMGNAETRLNSSTTGLLIAIVPLIAAVIVTKLGHDRLDARRVAGLVIGVAGVAALVGLDIHVSDFAAVGAVALCALGYATGPIIIDRKL